MSSDFWWAGRGAPSEGCCADGYPVIPTTLRGGGGCGWPGFEFRFRLGRGTRAPSDCGGVEENPVAVSVAVAPPSEEVPEPSVAEPVADREEAAFWGGTDEAV